MRFSIQVNGQAIDLSSGYSSFLPAFLEYTTDEFDTFVFSEINTCPPGSYSFGMPVKLFLDSNQYPCFVGKISDISYDYSEDMQWTVSYTVHGLKYWLNFIPVISNYDTADYNFNLPSNDPGYNPYFSGLTVGQMFKIVLDNHMSKLVAAGITGYVQSDLDAMTIVPPAPVNIGGPKILDALQGVLSSWQARYCIRVKYDTTNGLAYLRFENPFNYSSSTLTFGVDPIDPSSFSCKPDSKDCYGRVEYRGYAKVEAAILSVKEGTLLQSWTSTQQTNWNWNQFANPSGMISIGTVSNLSTVDCYCKPDNPSETWTANQWNATGTWIYLQYAAGTNAGNITFAEYRRLNSNQALTAGGTANVSWAGDIPVTGTNYNRYRIVGSNSSTSDVWRKYTIANSYVATHLVNSFPIPVPWAVSTTVSLIKYPSALVFWGNAGSTYGNNTYNVACGPVLFEIDKINGVIRFREPTVKPFNTQANLNTGGSSVTPPWDVQIIVPYSLGTLVASYPPDSYGNQNYSGTFYTATGIQRTLTFTDDNWIDPRQASQYQNVCQMLQECYKDVKYDGEVSYMGLYTSALYPQFKLNFAVNELVGVSQSLGLEGINCPVRVARITWNANGGADDFTTTLQFNNRKQPVTGQNYFIHPAFASVENAFHATSVEQALSSMSGSSPFNEGAFNGTGVGFLGMNTGEGINVDQGGNLPVPKMGFESGLGMGVDPSLGGDARGLADQLFAPDGFSGADRFQGNGNRGNLPKAEDMEGFVGPPRPKPEDMEAAQGPQNPNDIAKPMGMVGPPRPAVGPMGEYLPTEPRKSTFVPETPASKFVGPPDPRTALQRTGRSGEDSSSKPSSQDVLKDRNSRLVEQGKIFPTTEAQTNRKSTPKQSTEDILDKRDARIARDGDNKKEQSVEMGRGLGGREYMTTPSKTNAYSPIQYSSPMVGPPDMRSQDRKREDQKDSDLDRFPGPSTEDYENVKKLKSTYNYLPPSIGQYGQ
jgi:hypothetical protein